MTTIKTLDFTLDLDCSVAKAGEFYWHLEANKR
jgi:hypothetical protein